MIIMQLKNRDNAYISEDVSVEPGHEIGWDEVKYENYGASETRKKYRGEVILIIDGMGILVSLKGEGTEPANVVYVAKETTLNYHWDYSH